MCTWSGVLFTAPRPALSSGLWAVRSTISSRTGTRPQLSPGPKSISKQRCKYVRGEQSLSVNTILVKRVSVRHWVLVVFVCIHEQRRRSGPANKRRSRGEVQGRGKNRVGPTRLPPHNSIPPPRHRNSSQYSTIDGYFKQTSPRRLEHSKQRRHLALRSLLRDDWFLSLLEFNCLTSTDFVCRPRKKYRSKSLLICHLE